MPDSPTPDEPDFDTFLREVLQDTWDHANDGPDEAFDAIRAHPDLAGVVRIKRLPTRGG